MNTREQIQELYKTLEAKSAGLEEVFIGLRNTTKKLSKEDAEYAQASATTILEALEILEELNQIETNYEGSEEILHIQL